MWMAWLLVTTACGASAGTHGRGTLPEGHPPVAKDPAIIEAEVRGEPPTVHIMSVGERAVVGIDTMVDALSTQSVVFIGESHDQPAHHAVQRALIEALSEKREVMLGLEMFQAPYQSVLDDYVSGRIDEAAFIAQSEYEKRWGFEYALYRPILELARTKGIRVLALNAPSEVSRAVGRGGLDALDDAQRAALPELDLHNEAHRALVMDALKQHASMGEETLERFYTAQVIWDETMADRAVRGLRGEPLGGAAPESAEGEGEVGEPKAPLLIVLAGQMHVRAGLGIPSRVIRRGVSDVSVVLPIYAEEFSAELLGESPPAADYLWVLMNPGQTDIENPHVAE